MFHLQQLYLLREQVKLLKMTSLKEAVQDFA